jgi:hypothetical protein
MPSNIKIKSLAASAGRALDGSGNPTSAVSGSDMANIFLTGDVNQGVYRHVPDTIGSISGASPRPIGDQYQFYEFDGVVPGIVFNTITTVTDNTNVNIGRQISFTFTTTGVTSTSYNVKLYGYDSNQQNETLLDTYSGYSGNVTSEAKTFTGTLFANQINFFKLLLTTTSGPTRFGEDITSIYIYPIDLTITSIVLSPTFTGASFNYTTGSVGFTVNANGGIPPYFYNFNGAGFGSADANTATFNNSATTVQDEYDIVVKDSHLPTFDTATGRGTTFRPPIRVSISSINSSPEPYVNYTITPTITNNVDGLTLVYGWVLDGTSPSTSTDAAPVVYYTSLNSKTHRVNISHSTNSSIRHHNTATVTVAMIAPAFTSVSYAPSSETFSVSLNVSSLGTARSGTTRKFDIEYRLKDSGGSYGSWTSITSDSTSTSTSVSISGKTNTAQVVQSRARTRRSDGTTAFESSYAESTEVTIPQKGIINMDNQTNLLTGGDRSFDGNVTIGGVADTGYNTPTITAVSTDSTVTATISKPSSNIVRVVVNNPCTSLNDGTASHVISLKDGNGYNLTKSFTTQYKISSTSISLAASWINEQYYTNAYNAVSNNLSQYSFTLNSFAYKVGSGAYNTLNSGTLGSYYQHNYSAPTSDQTWTYRVVASGGTYTTSDTAETSLTVYGYPGQSYGYAIVGVPASGTLSQVQSVIARISRTSGNFTKISVNSYYATRPTGTVVSPPGKSDANISDSATSFDSDAFSLYDSAECGNNIVGVGALQAYLKYAINASLYYLHLIQAPNITVSNEPPSLTSTLISGITSDYAIRGNNIIHEISYSSYGPPIAGYYDFFGTFYDNAAYAYISQNTNPSSFSGITVNDENQPDSPSLGYYRIATDGTFCRKTRSVSFGYVPTGGQVGTNITLNYYAREYQINEIAIDEGGGRGGSAFTYLYDYFFDGSEATLTSSKTYTVRGRRLNASLCSWTIIVYTNKGYSDFQIALNEGTLTGPDGGIDYYNGNLDALTYVFQRWDGSSWVDIVSSTYDPGTFGTTLFRVKFTDTWGNIFTSAQVSSTTSDLDYTFTLTNENYVPPVYAYLGGSQSGAPLILNPAFTDNRAIWSTGTNISLDNMTVNEYVIVYEHDVRNMDEKGTYFNFDGAYTSISVSVTAGSTPAHGIFRTFIYTQSNGQVVQATRDFATSPYAGDTAEILTSVKSFRMFNSGDVTGNATLFSGGGISGNFRLMALLRAPSVYDATATYTLHGQKASNNTQQGTDYYVVLRTRGSLNVVNILTQTGLCGGIYVEYRTGQIDTATTLQIQESTDNSTFTNNAVYSSIASNTTYNAFITATGNATRYYRVRLLNSGGGVISTGTTYSYTNYAAGAAGSYSFLNINASCTSFTYRVDRPSGGNSNNNAYFAISWAIGDEYGNVGAEITSTTNKAYNTTHTMSLFGFPCDAPIQVTITPYSSTGCDGTAASSFQTVHKSDAQNALCGCAGGGGCLVYGTKVLMYDGSLKNVEDLIIGDIVKSIAINGLNPNIEMNWEGWLTNDFQYEDGLSIITNIDDNSFDEYYVFNNKLKATYEHPIFIKRGDTYKFECAENITIGDYMFTSNNEFELISSIDIIDDYVQTININIEENDVYFADGVLVHNIAPPKDER